VGIVLLVKLLVQKNRQRDVRPVAALRQAKLRAEAISQTPEFRDFVDRLRREFPLRFASPSPGLERDYLRVVDQHLEDLIPRMLPHLDPDIGCLLDFGCGSGGSAVALALTCPQIRIFGTDIDPKEIAVARERAKLYEVADRCEFAHVQANQPLPFRDESFDFALCSSVIEYVTATEARTFCIREMARLVKSDGLLFFSVPNRLYPFEIHTRKWGWNWFPKLLNARTVDCTFWEVRRLARPTVLRLRDTPVAQFLRPWSNFCVQKLPRKKA
jgi:ubiquinone/menaquinone biosynthesis C-methylase UbiE